MNEGRVREEERRVGRWLRTVVRVARTRGDGDDAIKLKRRPVTARGNNQLLAVCRDASWSRPAATEREIVFSFFFPSSRFYHTATTMNESAESVKSISSLNVSSFCEKTLSRFSVALPFEICANCRTWNYHAEHEILRTRPSFLRIRVSTICHFFSDARDLQKISCESAQIRGIQVRYSISDFHFELNRVHESACSFFKMGGYFRAMQIIWSNQSSIERTNESNGGNFARVYLRAR